MRAHWLAAEVVVISGLRESNAIPASSAASERAFSNTQFICEGRENLAGETIERLAVIRHHIQQLDEESLYTFAQKVSTPDSRQVVPTM